jgi:hypothetical protein
VVDAWSGRRNSSKEKVIDAVPDGSKGKQHEASNRARRLRAGASWNGNARTTFGTSIVVVDEFISVSGVAASVAPYTGPDAAQRILAGRFESRESAATSFALIHDVAAWCGPRFWLTSCRSAASGVSHATASARRVRAARRLERRVSRLAHVKAHVTKVSGDHELGGRPGPAPWRCRR